MTEITKHTLVSDIEQIICQLSQLQSDIAAENLHYAPMLANAIRSKMGVLDMEITIFCNGKEQPCQK